MRRGSFKRRLPRGRRSLRISPAMLSIAVFLILLVPAIFYLFPQSPASHPASASYPSSSDGLADASPAPEEESLDGGSDPVLKVTSQDAGLLATVNGSQGRSRVYLENNGSLELHRVEVQGDGKALGVLSRLVPGEKKVLVLSAPAKEIKVLALDPSGRKIWGEVHYSQPEPAADRSGSLPDERLVTQAAPVAPEASVVSGTASPLCLVMASNRSDGMEGDIVGYRCTVANTGPEELSDVRIFCAGKMASTRFLTPGKELSLEGELAIEESMDLSAGVQAKDARDRTFTNNTSIYIWKISSQVGLQAEAPKHVHRGESVTLAVRIENRGDGNLTGIELSDLFGTIGRIDSLAPGASQLLHKQITVFESVRDEVRATARDASGKEVYASLVREIGVLNSTLQIDGEPPEVRAYPGAPAKVTWQLRNTGEEVIRNITLQGDGKRCMLRELSPGRSVRMAAIYSKDSSTWINVTAQGCDPRGYVVLAEGCVFLRAIKPGISLKVMPAELEVCPGETAEIHSLITNTGDDSLTDVALSQDGTSLASVGSLAPGEFRVVDSRTVISVNSTLHFLAIGKDSSGQTWSGSASVDARAVVFALKVFSSAAPATVLVGNSTRITCTVANTGAVPLYSIFVISKKFGPLGSIEYLPPKRQMMVSAEKTVADAVDDVITAEGFTQEKRPVRGWSTLHVALLKHPGAGMKGAMGDVLKQERPPEHPPEQPGSEVVGATLGCGNLSLPIGLPPEEKTASKASSKIARAVDRRAVQSSNVIMDGMANLLRYVEKILGRAAQEAEPSAASEFRPAQGGNLSAARNYELAIAGVKSSEHGAISVLDVSASPSQPAAGEPVKITIHAKSEPGIRLATVKYGMADVPLTRQDMLGVKRIHDSPLVLESGSDRDGYWSSTIPGKAAGTYLVLSVWLTDGVSTAEAGPYMLHWSTVNSEAEKYPGRSIVFPASGSGMLFIESSSVQGRGEVSIKDTFQGAAMHYSEKLIGNGSISLESMRCIDHKTSLENFTEQKDLVFTGGNLKGRQTVESPTFHGGMGASVTERFNLSHVDRSEASSVSSASYANNTLVFKTEQAFDGTWNIQTQYAKFYKKIKADQEYTGSFQTQKSIKFQDAGQK